LGLGHARVQTLDQSEIVGHPGQHVEQFLALIY
jgi:hypothetical protein